MCKICGNPEHETHSDILNNLLGDITENNAETLRRIAALSGPEQATISALVAATALIGVVKSSEFPVPVIDVTDQHGLGFEWRSQNRVLEIEVFPDGKDFEFLVASIEETEGENIDLVYRLGQFSMKDLEEVPEENRGLGGLADWLVGGEFPEFLDRYLSPELESVEGTCLTSEPGSPEPT